MNRQKPTIGLSRSIVLANRGKQLREPVETLVDPEIGKTDTGQSREATIQVLVALTVESLATMFLTAGR